MPKFRALSSFSGKVDGHRVPLIRIQSLVSWHKMQTFVLFVRVHFTINLKIGLCPQGHSKPGISQRIAVVNAPANAREVAQLRNICQAGSSKILLPQLHITFVTHCAGERKIERRRATQRVANAGDRGLTRLRHVRDGAECPAQKFIGGVCLQDRWWRCLEVKCRAVYLDVINVGSVAVVAIVVLDPDFGDVVVAYDFQPLGKCAGRFFSVGSHPIVGEFRVDQINLY